MHLYVIFSFNVNRDIFINGTKKCFSHSICCAKYIILYNFILIEILKLIIFILNEN